MDIFEFRATRVVNTDGVFETFKEGDGDLGGLFTGLKNPLPKSTLSGYIAFLETYIKNYMVPRSLRWEVCPQRGEVELEEWYKYFNEAEVNFLWFLVERKTSKLGRLDDEVKNIKEKITPFKSSDEYIERSKNLLKLLEKEDREQKIKKKKKYNRDLADYQS